METIGCCFAQSGLDFIGRGNTQRLMPQWMA